MPIQAAGENLKIFLFGYRNPSHPSRAWTVDYRYDSRAGPVLLREHQLLIFDQKSPKVGSSWFRYSS
jgi:hypothetical protein